MKIISNIKDYYDFVAHVYGGGDPKIVYNRTRITPLNLNAVIEEPDLIVDVPTREVPHIYEYDYIKKRYKYQFEYSFKWLAVAGKYYLLVRQKERGNDLLDPPFELLNVEKHEEILNTLKRAGYSWRNHTLRTMDYYLGSESDKLVEISRKIGHPVFIINPYAIGVSRNKQSCVEARCPILGDLGMASIVDPYQMYQDLSYFMGNVIHESPDLAPPVQIDDKNRLVQHGFDLKKSFRHRK